MGECVCLGLGDVNYFPSKKSKKFRRLCVNTGCLVCPSEALYHSPPGCTELASLCSECWRAAVRSLPSAALLGFLKAAVSCGHRAQQKVCHLFSSLWKKCSHSWGSEQDVVTWPLRLWMLPPCPQSCLLEISEYTLLYLRGRRGGGIFELVTCLQRSLQVYWGFNDPNEIK